MRGSSETSTTTRRFRLGAARSSTCLPCGPSRCVRRRSRRSPQSFSYDELIARDKANLDITRLRDESLEDLDNLPSPDVIDREIVEDLSAALSEFEAVAAALEAQLPGGAGDPD